MDFPYNELLGPDFGYVTRVAQRKDVSSLDSFGNLEVSPPVTVNGKNYPLGRIIIGVAFPTATKGRNMTKVVQDFLWAQKVQEPIALFSDWLVVGHVDEFMSFVPAPDRKAITILVKNVKSNTISEMQLQVLLGYAEEDISDQSAPPGSKFFSVKCTADVQYCISPPSQETSHLSPIPLNGNSVLLICMCRASQYENDNKLYGVCTTLTDCAMMHSRTLRVDYDKPTQVVCVVGYELTVKLHR
eukprot:superscaffoldBa00008784_g23619